MVDTQKAFSFQPFSIQNLYLFTIFHVFNFYEFIIFSDKIEMVDTQKAFSFGKVDNIPTSKFKYLLEIFEMFRGTESYLSFIC